MRAVGLVVGKFCPLHRGHQLLIEFAQARCERLVILSYTKPEFPSCAPAERARWLGALYPDTTRLVLDDAALADFAARTRSEPRRLPDNDAPDDDHRTFVGWACQAVLGVVVDVVFTSETYGDGFAAALTAFYRAAGLAAHRVDHSCFDLPRAGAPISGTQIRRDPAAHRSDMPDVVAASFFRYPAGQARAASSEA